MSIVIAAVLCPDRLCTVFTSAPPRGSDPDSHPTRTRRRPGSVAGAFLFHGPWRSGSGLPPPCVADPRQQPQRGQRRRLGDRGGGGSDTELEVVHVGIRIGGDVPTV